MLSDLLEELQLHEQIVHKNEILQTYLQGPDVDLLSFHHQHASAMQYQHRQINQLVSCKLYLNHLLQQDNHNIE